MRGAITFLRSRYRKQRNWFYSLRQFEVSIKWVTSLTDCWLYPQICFLPLPQDMVSQLSVTDPSLPCSYEWPGLECPGFYLIFLLLQTRMQMICISAWTTQKSPMSNKWQSKWREEPGSLNDFMEHSCLTSLN